MIDELSSSSSSSLRPHGEKEARFGSQVARHMDRLRWRCRRGLLELDLVLTGFLERHYPGLTPEEQVAFDKLLEVSDETLLGYVQGGQVPSENNLRQIVEKLRK